MFAPSPRPLLAVGLLVFLLAACETDLPTFPGEDAQPTAEAPAGLRIAVASDGEEDGRVVGGIDNPLTRSVIAPVLSRYALCVE